MHLKITRFLKTQAFLRVIILGSFLLVTTGAWVRVDTVKLPPAVEEPPIPGLDGTILDDRSGQFSLRGPVKYWNEEDHGYGGHFWWTKNNLSGVENAAKWYLNITESGMYELYVYIPTMHASTKKATYFIYHNGLLDQANVDQSANHNTWYKLGEFLISGSGDEYIELVDETGEVDTEFEIAFDAVGYSWIEPEWEEKITGALWERIRPWLDEKTADIQEKFKEWLDEQKGKLLQQLADSLKDWIDQQCASLSATLLIPLFAFVLWLRQRHKPTDSE
jgi:hypothetical protein